MPEPANLKTQIAPASVFLESLNLVENLTWAMLLSHMVWSDIYAKNAYRFRNINSKSRFCVKKVIFVGNFSSWLTSAIFNMTLAFPDWLENLQIVQNLSRLSGNLPDFPETFQIVQKLFRLLLCFHLILSQFCWYVQKLHIVGAPLIEEFSSLVRARITVFSRELSF